MKESWSRTLWNEENRRCGVADIAEKAKEDNIKAHAIRDEQTCSSRYCKGEYGMDT
jgi:hypothetical protein